MLWITSLFFIPCAFRAFRKKRPLASALLSALSTTSVLHHNPFIHIDILWMDKPLAHACGIWGLITGVRTRLWSMVPFGAWAPLAYYIFEPRVSKNMAHFLHASIHLSSAHVFLNILK